jgi:hypothetical protein
MIGTLLVVLLILAVGTRAGDAVEVRQQEIVLAKLSIPEAQAYYQRLRRRAWRARALRGLAVLSLIALVYTARRLLPANGSDGPRPAPPPVSGGAHLTQRAYASGKVFQVAEAAFQPVKPSQ